MVSLDPPNLITYGHSSHLMQDTHQRPRRKLLQHTQKHHYAQRNSTSIKQLMLASRTAINPPKHSTQNPPQTPEAKESIDEFPNT